MKYHCVKQHDITDCGAACLATISKQNGYKISITKIREVSGRDKSGTNMFGIVKAADGREKIQSSSKKLIFFPHRCISFKDLKTSDSCGILEENQGRIGQNIFWEWDYGN